LLARREQWPDGELLIIAKLDGNEAGRLRPPVFPHRPAPGSRMYFYRRPQSSACFL